MNRLYYGDCLSIMQSELRQGTVDLVYLDPPFNSNRDYNAIYKDETNRPLPDQIEAFNDLWELSEERQRAIRMMPVLMRDAGISDDIAEFWKTWMNALRNTQPRLLAYLSYMTERLLALRGIMKPTGSMFLHCDPTASHYIKVMMDGIFGHDAFVNEIIWKRAIVKGDTTRKFASNHDVILFYSASSSYYFQSLYNPMSDEYKGRFKLDDKDGKGPYRLAPLDSPSPRPNLTYSYKGYTPPQKGWRVNLASMEQLDAEGRLAFPRGPAGRIARKHYLREQAGPKMDDVWGDIAPLQSEGERLGYPTQKPLALMRRIIEATTKPGDLVLDPFCGCASTIEAAHDLGRRWIGIDIAIHAIKRVAKVRLEERLGLKEGLDFVIEGVPHNLEGARDLWERDKYQFQKWAIEQVDGFVTNKKTADGGIDGRLYFSLPDGRDLESMIIEVKGGQNVGIDVLRVLRGVLDGDRALVAGLIVMEDLGPRKMANFRRDMGNVGDLDVNGVLYPRMQMLTVPEIVAGKRFLTPTVARGRGVAQPRLPLG